MRNHHIAAALLALASIAVLPACSPMYGQSSSTAPAASRELSPGMVRQVQTTLQQQNFYRGNIDGVWGPATQTAVQSFQQARGLRASGELNSETLTALNAPANAGAPSTQEQPNAPPPALQPAPGVPPSGPPPY